MAGAVGYWRQSGKFIVFKAPAVVLATGGIGKSYAITSNSWEYTGDGHAMALRRGRRPHRHGVRPVPPDRDGLAAERARHPRHRGRARRRRNAPEQQGRALHVPLHPRLLQGGDGGQRGRGRSLVRGQEEQPPDAGPPAAGRGRAGDQRRGQGGPGQPSRRRLPRHQHAPLGRLHPAAPARRCTTSSRSWPGVDITKEAMEVGPTCHYIMGGVRVDADTTAAAGLPGLFAAGEVAGGMHGSNRLGGNSLSDLLVFGRRAGQHAAEHARAVKGTLAVDAGQVEAAVAGGAGARRAPDRREPVRDPEGSPGDHAEPGRHHPDRVAS